MYHDNAFRKSLAGMARLEPTSAEPSPRRKAVTVDIGGVKIGGDRPIAIQSMTDTDTGDIASSVDQVKALIDAGSEMVRLTIDRDEAAANLPKIKEKLFAAGYHAPLIGDFHYNGHDLLSRHDGCAQMLDKYRINPGNVGFGERRDAQFSAIIATALAYDKPIRIGVNWGSLDQGLLTALMEIDGQKAAPRSAEEITREAMVLSALQSAERARELGLPAEKIVLSVKVSDTQNLIAIYRALAGRCEYPLHLGLTEAGGGVKGVVASAASIGILLQEGIGDTIRFSLTPAPGESREREARAARELLQAMNFRAFQPSVTACPGCGRTGSVLFRQLAADIDDFIEENMPVWRQNYPGAEQMKIAVMGCIVNGPGESKQADIGISLPGNNEEPSAPVYIDGKRAAILRGPDIGGRFKSMIVEYIAGRYGSPNKTS